MTPLGAGPAADADPPGTTGGSAVLVAGCVLVAWTLVAAVLIRLHPEANALDRWGTSLAPADPHSAFDLKVAGVRTVVLAGGSVLAAVVAVGRDRWRALACLLGPAATALGVEAVLKPVIARRFEAVLIFPSGTVAVVAAVAHKEFRSLSVQGLALKLKPQGVWVDVKAAYDSKALQAAGFTVWRL